MLSKTMPAAAMPANQQILQHEKENAEYGNETELTNYQMPDMQVKQAYLTSINE